MKPILRDKLQRHIQELRTTNKHALVECLLARASELCAEEEFNLAEAYIRMANACLREVDYV